MKMILNMTMLYAGHPSTIAELSTNFILKAFKYMVIHFLKQQLVKFVKSPDFTMRCN